MRRRWLANCVKRALGVVALGFVAVLLAPALASAALSWSPGFAIMGPSTAFQSTVACPSASLCVAADGSADGDLATSTNPTGGASAWHVAHVDGANTILAVACASASLCVATDKAGNVVTSTDPAGGAGAWQVTNLPTNAASPPNALTSLSPNALWGVSCPSVSLCVVTGVLTTGKVKVYTSTNPTGGASAWTATATPLPVPVNGGLVSCPSVALCVIAAGGEVETSTSPLGGASAWSVASDGLPSGDLVGGVSCPSVSLCVITDIDSGPNNLATSTNPTGGSSAWTSISLTSPAGSVVKPFGVSCASVSLCVVAGEDVLSSTNPAGGAAAWSTTPLANGDGAVGVSCPSVSLCVAVTGEGDALIGTPASGSTGSSGSTGPAVGPHVMITSIKVSSTRRQATIKFDASGATGFQCALKRAGHAEVWKDCVSPRHYKQLKNGSYTFFVRAIGAGDVDGPTVLRRFNIT